MAIPDSHIDIRGPTDPECLRVAVGAFAPYVWHFQKEDVYRGPFLDLFDIISEKVGFCYNRHHMTYAAFGILLPNGTWTGFMRKMVDKEIDVLGPMLAFAPDRLSVMDFTPVINLENHGMMIQWPELEPDMAGFVKPFTLDVWLCLFASVLVVALTMWLLGYVGAHIQTSKHETKRPNLLTEFRRGMMVTIRGLLNQALTEKLTMGYIITGCWLIIIVVVGVVYKANLKAKLIAPRVRLPFRNLDEFVDYKDMKPMIVPNTVLQKAFMDSPEESSYKKILNRATMEASPPTVIRKTMDGSHGFFMYRMTILSFIDNIFRRNQRCELTILNDYFVPQLLGIGISRTNPYKKKIQKAVRNLIESGIVKKLIDDSVTKGLLCQNPENQKVDLKPLELEDVYGILLTYLTGVALALLAFVMELIVHKCQKDDEERMIKIEE